jgi:N-acetylneuraminic acid mutarotase
LDSIEKYNLAKNSWETLHIRIPIPLRRFMVVRVAKNLVLIMGGLTKFSKES